MLTTPAVLPNRSRTLPNAIMPFRSLSPCFTSSFAQPEVVAASTQCSILAFLLVSLQYPSRSIINEHSVRHATARVEQHTHGVHLRSLVLTSRHHHTPFHGVLQLEEIIFPLQSRLIPEKCTSVPSPENNDIASITRLPRYHMENWAPLPKGFPQHNKSGSVRHVRELQGVMTS